MKITKKWLSDVIYEVEWLDFPLRRKETNEIANHIINCLEKREGSLNE